MTCAVGMTPLAKCQADGTLGACTCSPLTAAAGGASTGVGGAATGATAGNAAAGAKPPGVGASGTGGGAPYVAGTGGVLPPGGAAGGGGTTVTPDSGDYGSWPMMGYDTRNNYNNPKETILSVANAPMLKEKWRTKLAGFPPGTPVVGGGRVFIQASGGTFAVSLATGEKLWQRDDLAGTSSIAYADGFVYVHINAADLFKLNAVDGTNVWGPVRTFDPVGCDGESSPIVANNMVFVGHSCGPMETASDATADTFAKAKGGVEAFDISNGQRVWTYLTVPAAGPENGAMVWSTVSVDLEAKVLYAGTGNNYSVQGENSDSIHAVDLMTGMRLWKTQVHTDDTWSIAGALLGPDTDFGANPILADIDGMPVVADGDKGSNFHAMDRKTGKILWQRTMLSTSRNPQNGGILMNGAFDGNNFYVLVNQPNDTANPSVLRALDARKQGADAWPAKSFGALSWGAPALGNGVLVVPNGSHLYVLNAKTSEMLASFDTGGTIAAGSPAIVDGNIVVTSGLTYMYAPEALQNDEVICYAVPGAKAPDIKGGAVPTTPTFVPGSPTFSAVYQEIIVGRGCNGAPTCHASMSGGNLTMRNKAEAYLALVGIKGMGVNGPGAATPNCADTGLTRVVPNDPANSLLLDKVASAAPKCGTVMPPGSMLTAPQIEQIRAWIMAGAKDD